MIGSEAPCGVDWLIGLIPDPIRFPVSPVVSEKPNKRSMKSTETEPRLLLLGIGNLLMGDEGVGVHAARRLADQDLPPGVAVLDGGTGGFHLMEYFERYPRMIMIDATLDQRPPGTIRLLRPRFTPDFPKAMSTHDIGLKDLVEGLSILGRLPDIHLFAVSIERIQPMHIGLSDPLEAVMPDLLERVRTLAGQLQTAEVA